jgi:GNAT superfamily N-acetyltransferase
MLPQLSPEALFEEVIVAPRRAFPALPELRVIERPGWLQIVTPSNTSGGLNQVAYSVLDETDADAVIDATIAEYRALGLKFRWNVSPDSAPADLGERLARRGLVGSWGRGMARATTGLATRVDPAITVAEVDRSTVDEFSRVMAEGWSLDRAPLARINDVILAAPDRPQRLFLARCDGEPAATASYVAFPRSAYLIGGVVLPRFRGRGLYRALVATRLVDAHARGIGLATSHAREASSAPILERLGFATICRFPMYFG